MQTKLTVRVDRELVEVAKRFAAQQGISLSRLIENYLNFLAIKQDESLAETPILHRMSGILTPDISLDDYYRHLEDKYGYD